MALGELYEPSGQALDTARAVLEVERPYANSIAVGCTNRCTYCYGRKKYAGSEAIRFPDKPPVEMVKSQIRKKGAKAERLVRSLNEGTGVFISFMTDPLLEENKKATMDLYHYITNHFTNTRIAVLTKCGYPSSFFHPLQESKWLHENVRLGVTVVSSYKIFRDRYEPNAPLPEVRIRTLQELHKLGYFTFLSFEPDPSPVQFEHDPIKDVLFPLKDSLDLVVYGKWNYDKGCESVTALRYYRQQVPRVTAFCEKQGIRLYVKEGTKDFIARGR